MPEEFAELQRLIKRFLWRVCPRWQVEDVEDLTQRSLMRLIEVLRKQQSSNGLPHSYVLKIAYTQMIDEIRRRQREESVDTSIVEPISKDPSPERSTMVRELGVAIWNCLQKLNGNRKYAAFLMLIGHKNREIAALTGWDPKRAENYVSRGRADLKKCLQNLGYEP